MIRFRRALLIGLAMLLVGAMGLIGYGETRVPPPTFTGRLVDLLPGEHEVPGWKRDLRPLAETPEAAEKVRDILSFDDAVFAVFTRGSERVSVYLAYWRPGKMSQRLVASHTPDVCWVASGWTPTSAAATAELTAKGKRLMPAQQRQMVLRAPDRTRDTNSKPVRSDSDPVTTGPSTPLPGPVETVLFWHVAGGRLLSYGDARPPWHAAVWDLWRSGLRQREEQFFIRLSSPADDLVWWTSDPVQALGRGLTMVHAR